jgi:hypothetical protein
MDEEAIQELIRRLFVLVTTKLEDGAGLAAEGQGRSVATETRIVLANRLHALGEEISTLADAVLAVVSVN